jgi:hypothetical protein
MVATNWYFTDTSYAALNGYWGDPADNERELDTTAPGSGTLSASIAKGSTEAAIAAATNATPHASTHRDWSGIPVGDVTLSVDVNSTHADLTLDPNTRWMRLDSGGTYITPFLTAAWDSNSGTGVKVFTSYATGNLGIAAVDDIFGAVVAVDNAGHMDPQTIVFNLGSSTYVEFWGGKPASLSLVCGAECQIHNTGSGPAADSHWMSRVAGNSGTPEASTAVARSGSYSLYFSSATSGGLSNLRHDAPDGDHAYFRGYFRLPDVSPTNDTCIVAFADSANVPRVGVYVNTDGTLRFKTDNGTNVSSTNNTALSTDTWYGVEFELEDVDDTSGDLIGKWRVWTEGGGWTTSETVTDPTTGVFLSKAMVGICTDAGEARVRPTGLCTGTTSLSGMALGRVPSTMTPAPTASAARCSG